MNSFDLVIKNARIIDGTGSPWYRGDVGIRDGKIAYIGKIESSENAEIIDAKDKVLAPGFIDCHTHSDFLLLREPEMTSKLAQGITTVMIGASAESVPLPYATRKKNCWINMWVLQKQVWNQNTTGIVSENT